MTEKNPYVRATVDDEKKNDEPEWEMRPGGMLVQKREDENGSDASSSDPMITVSVTYGYGPDKYRILLPAQSTFGDMKKHLAQRTGLQPEEQRLLFRGKEKDDDEHLHTAGVKNLSKVLLLEDHASKERKLEDIKKNAEISKASEAVAGLRFEVDKFSESHASKDRKLEDTKENIEVSKASEAIARVRSEVDKLSDRVAALEVAVDCGTNVSDQEFVVPTELLMRQLLKLDSIDAEGEAKLQRKAEVRRVQNFVDKLDALKARNYNPCSNNHNTVSVTTEWETFDSGVGSLTPPSPAPSSTRVTHNWERFD